MYIYIQQKDLSILMLICLVISRRWYKEKEFIVHGMNVVYSIKGRIFLVV